MDPGFAIIGAVLAVVLGLLALAWRMRGAVLRRREALRQSERVEVPIVSALRGAGIVLVLVPLVPALVLVPAFMLDTRHEHGLAVVITVIAVSGVAVVAAIPLVQRFARIGQLSLDADQLVFETPREHVVIDLHRPFRLREATIPPGHRVETLVVVSQPDAGGDEAHVIAFRYPCLLKEDRSRPKAPPPRLWAPSSGRKRASCTSG